MLNEIGTEQNLLKMLPRTNMPPWSMFCFNQTLLKRRIIVKESIWQRH